MIIKKNISIVKAGNRLNINIPTEIIYRFDIQAGHKNAIMEIDTDNKDTLIIKLKRSNNAER